MPTDCLAVFAKHWTSGKVKTRLAADLGEQAAAQIHRALLAATLARLGRVGGRNVDRVLVVDPPEAAPAMRSLAAKQWRIEVQSSGDLGARMRAFFDAQIANGSRHTVLLGSDSPNVPLSYVQRAFAGLHAAQIALGPSSDGGYYLVGAARSTPQIFEGMPWSSDRLYRATMEELVRRGDRYVEVPKWYDVDDIDDLRRLLADVDESEPADGDLARLAGEIRRIAPRLD